MHPVTSIHESVKPSVLAALFAGVVLFVFAIRKKHHPQVPAFVNSDIRYDIEEYIGDDEL